MIMWLLALTRVAAEAVRSATEALSFENTMIVVVVQALSSNERT